MLVIKTIPELLESIAQIKNNNKAIAFVPTMGNLHKGHVSLIDLAHKQASIVVVSVFVNPLQFNQTKDLIEYPKTLEQDILYCEQYNVDILFTPSDDEIYPVGDNSKRIELPELHSISTILEGVSRPDHFSGVVTIVKKLFDLVKPDFAIFGEKDFQQLLIIQKMVEVLQLPIKIISSETIRETDGLAISSRNSKLSSHERLLAANLFKILQSIRDQITDGNKNFTELTKAGRLKLSELGFNPDYIAICDSFDLQQSSPEDNNSRVILIAAELGKTRLIDNLMV